ncbi:MAG: metallophosphoesterase [Isosphaeraceae bacterium]
MRRTSTAKPIAPPPGTQWLGDWLFTPEGAVVHRREQSAVIADVHLGYEWARGAAGDCVPAHSLAETLARLHALLGRTVIRRLIVAGDLVESGRRCRRTAGDLRRLREWLAGRGVELTALEGNHDRGGRPFPPADLPSPLPASCDVAGWTIAHGHRPIEGKRTITGHLHPVLRAEGTVAPCFLAGPDRIILPAFSNNAAGCDVLAGPIPRDWLAGSLRCLASTGSEVLDFGPLAALRHSPAL